jgi:hypothetical protein
MDRASPKLVFTCSGLERAGSSSQSAPLSTLQGLLGAEQRGDAQQSLVVVVQGPVKAHHLLIYTQATVFTEIFRDFPREFELTVVLKGMRKN